MAKILFVLTGADHWTLADGTQHPTGFWAEEAVAPYEAFRPAGHEIVVATPGGVVPTVDKGSLAAEVNGGQEGRRPDRRRARRHDRAAAAAATGGRGPRRLRGRLLPGRPRPDGGPGRRRRIRASPGRRPGLGQAPGRGLPRPCGAARRGLRGRRQRLRRATGSPRSPTPRSTRPAWATRRSGCCRTGSPRRASTCGSASPGRRTSWSTATSSPARTPPPPPRSQLNC